MAGVVLVLGLLATLTAGHVRGEDLSQHRVFRRGAADGPGIVPVLPRAWPSTDQLVMISGDLLKDPLVVDALAVVTKVVPASLLSVPVSNGTGNAITYRGNAVANCYWPNGQCIRRTGGVGYEADVYTCAQQNTWGFTLDDGPSSNVVGGTHVSDTAAIRDALAKLQKKATFFVTGSKSFENPSELTAHVAAGHQIACHTWSHHALTSLTNEQVVAELMYTQAIIYNVTGLIPTYMRPPYGDVDDRVRAIANALGMVVVLWDRDSQDAALSATTNGADYAFNNITAWVRNPGPGFISLEHDISQFTSGVAVRALQYVLSVPNFPYSIVPAATCNKHPFYHNGAHTTRAATTTKSTASIAPTTTFVATITTASQAAFTVTGIAAPSGAAQAGSSSAAGRSIRHLRFTEITFALFFVLLAFAVVRS